MQICCSKYPSSAEFHRQNWTVGVGFDTPEKILLHNLAEHCQNVPEPVGRPDPLSGANARTRPFQGTGGYLRTIRPPTPCRAGSRPNFSIFLNLPRFASEFKWLIWEVANVTMRVMCDVGYPLDDVDPEAAGSLPPKGRGSRRELLSQTPFQRRTSRVPAGSERFRFVPRTCEPPCGRLETPG
jgi:hypothetical protein